MRVMLILSLSFAELCFGENWPQWRGPNLDGSSNEKNLPVKWSKTENVTWSLPMPSRSGSTPIIWGERVLLNVADGDNLELWCLTRDKGEVLWKKPITGGNFKINKQNMSSPSPVTDGKTIYIMTGTGIVKAFDFDGKQLWERDIQKDYGKFGLNWGFGSSPLLYNDSLYINVLHGMKTDDPSYVLRVEAKTGKTLAKVERPTTAQVESPDAYTTPTVYSPRTDRFRRRPDHRARSQYHAGIVARRCAEPHRLRDEPHHHVSGV
jgi:outer membrane protein assembly factor BamB